LYHKWWWGGVPKSGLIHGISLFFCSGLKDLKGLEIKNPIEETRRILEHPHPAKKDPEKKTLSFVMQ
jgi:hypothetical protein